MLLTHPPHRLLLVVVRLVTPQEVSTPLLTVEQKEVQVVLHLVRLLLLRLLLTRGRHRHLTLRLLTLPLFLPIQECKRQRQEHPKHLPGVLARLLVILYIITWTQLAVRIPQPLLVKLGRRLPLLRTLLRYLVPTVLVLAVLIAVVSRRFQP